MQTTRDPSIERSSRDVPKAAAFAFGVFVKEEIGSDIYIKEWSTPRGGIYPVLYTVLYTATYGGHTTEGSPIQTFHISVSKENTAAKYHSSRSGRAPHKTERAQSPCRVVGVYSPSDFFRLESAPGAR